MVKATKETRRFYVTDSPYNEDGWCVMDRLTGKVVGEDGGEPEDQILVRDWAWVPEALNNVEDEYKMALTRAESRADGYKAIAKDQEFMLELWEQLADRLVPSWRNINSPPWVQIEELVKSLRTQ